MAEVEVDQQANFRLMAEQLKKDREDTIGRLKEIAKINTKAAKDAAEGSDKRKDALKKAAKASKELVALQKTDISTAGAVKKEFGNIGNSLLGGFDGMLSEAFGPLGGIASTLTTGLVRRKNRIKEKFRFRYITRRNIKRSCKDFRRNRRRYARNF